MVPKQTRTTPEADMPIGFEADEKLFESDGMVSAYDSWPVIDMVNFRYDSIGKVLFPAELTAFDHKKRPVLTPLTSLYTDGNLKAAEQTTSDTSMTVFQFLQQPTTSIRAKDPN